MRVVLAASDPPVQRGLDAAFSADEVTLADLAGTTEPGAFATVDAVDPAVVVLVPRWSEDGSADEAVDIGACWWWARAADLAGIPVVLLSTSAVFGAPRAHGCSEFDRPAPTSVAGRAADAAEQLLARATRGAVVVRVGPLDVGATALSALLTAPDGVEGGAGAVVTPASVASVGPVLRSLAVGRRPGIYHLESGMLSLGECAARLGIAPPRPGPTPVPAPLVGRMRDIAGHAALSAWPPSPEEPSPPGGPAPEGRVHG